MSRWPRIHFQDPATKSRQPVADKQSTRSQETESHRTPVKNMTIRAVNPSILKPTVWGRSLVSFCFGAGIFMAMALKSARPEYHGKVGPSPVLVTDSYADPMKVYL